MDRKVKCLVAAVLLITAVFAAVGCGGGDAVEQEELKKVTVMLDWVPNTNHTGLYVAQEMGYFEEHGLEVEIIQPSQTATAQMVAAGQVPFGVSYQEEVTMARATDVPIVSIAAVIQHNTSGFASLKEDAITSPMDFENKRYGGWGSPVEEATIKSLMEKHNADFDSVEFVNVGAADWFSIIGKEVDFTWIYYGWTGIEAELRGVDINYIELIKEDPALDFYTPVIITNESLLSEDPELVKSFIAAVTQGYEYAIDNPDESAEILLSAVPELDPELVKASQQYLSKKYQDDAPRWGEQKHEIWENYAQWLADRDLIEKMIEVENVFTNDFLP